MLQLNNLESLVKKRKKRGRGGSRGGTSGRGHKGQKARSGVGGELKGHFEGGQMSLTRRLPRRGFTNGRFKKDVVCFSLTDLETRFESGETVSRETLTQKGLLSKKKRSFFVKILANGSLQKALTVSVDACSQKAAALIQECGGTIQVVKETNSDSPAS